MCEYRRDLLPESESNLEGNHTGSLSPDKMGKNAKGKVQIYALRNE